MMNSITAAIQACQQDQELLDVRPQRDEGKNVSLESDGSDDTYSISQDPLSSRSSSQQSVSCSSPIEEYFSSKEKNNDDSFAYWDEKMKEFSPNSLF